MDIKSIMDILSAKTSFFSIRNCATSIQNRKMIPEPEGHRNDTDVLLMCDAGSRRVGTQQTRFVAADFQCFLAGGPKADTFVYAL
jgi:hypothetical protein